MEMGYVTMHKTFSWQCVWIGYTKNINEPLANKTKVIPLFFCIIFDIKRYFDIFGSGPVQPASNSTVTNTCLIYSGALSILLNEISLLIKIITNVSVSTGHFETISSS